MMKYKLTNILVLILASFGQVVIAQTDLPCFDNDKIPLPNGIVFQSSTSGSNGPDIAIDGVAEGSVFAETSSLTRLEKNPFWQVELNELAILSEVTIHFPTDYNNNELSDFYIFSSKYPISEKEITNNLTSKFVNSTHVVENIENSNTIPLGDVKGQYIRIQLNGEAYRQLALTEVGITGQLIIPGDLTVEDCANGVDDDCDGDIDCLDSDCGPIVYNVVKIDPTCPVCNDGQITVGVVYDNSQIDMLLYSLNDGIDYVPFNPVNSTSAIHVFDNLSEGSFIIRVTNGFCTSEPVEIELSSPRGRDDESNCAGGFESGSLTGWKAYRGLYLAESVDEMNELPPADLFLYDAYNIKQGNPTTPSGGTYYLDLGDNGSGSDVYGVSKEFEVSIDNSNFSFNYTLTLGDDFPPESTGHIGTRSKFVWRLSIQEPGGGYSEIESQIIMADDDLFFAPEGLSEDWKMKNWVCEYLDLSEFLGENLRIEFIIYECGLGGHEAIASIDGVCLDPSNSPPSAIFEIPDCIFSQDVIVNVDDQISFYNQYSINLCSSSNNCTSQGLINGYNIGTINIGELAELNQFELECGENYSLVIELANDCGGNSIHEELFTYICSDFELDYPEEIIVCGQPEGVVIPGNVICDECEILWTPSQWFNDPTWSNPVIDGTVSTNAYNNVYTINADVVTNNGVACTGSKDIIVRNINTFFDYVIVQDECEYYLDVFISVSTDIPEFFLSYGDDFDISFLDEISGNIYTPSLISESLYERNYRIDLEPNVTAKMTINYDFESDDETSTAFAGWCRQTFQIELPRLEEFDPFIIHTPKGICGTEPTSGNCEREPFDGEELYNTNIGTEDYPKYCYNIFVPKFGRQTIINGECRIDYDNPPEKITRAKLLVVASNGGIVWDKEVVRSLNDEPFTGREIAWNPKWPCSIGCGSEGYCYDGTYCIWHSSTENCHFYKYWPSGVYVYQLTIWSSWNECYTENVSVDQLCLDVYDNEELEGYFRLDKGDYMQEYSGEVAFDLGTIEN